MGSGKPCGKAGSLPSGALTLPAAHENWARRTSGAESDQPDLFATNGKVGEEEYCVAMWPAGTHTTVPVFGCVCVVQL